MVEIKFEIGFLGMLTILFIAMKLMHYIDWSWIWVLCPIWLPLFCALIITAMVLIVVWVREWKY
jgi:hypothetical protein